MYLHVTCSTFNVCLKNPSLDFKNSNSLPTRGIMRRFGFVPSSVGVNFKFVCYSRLKNAKSVDYVKKIDSILKTRSVWLRTLVFAGD